MKNLKAPLRILLTDDDEGDRLIFKDIIDEIDRNTNVHLANNGQEMMEYLADQNNHLPQVIFLDLNMPDMNGIECLKKIREVESYSDISIIIYSTSTSEKDIKDTFMNGANIYITKPSDYSELKKVLGKALSTTRLNRNSEFDRSNFVLKI